MKLELMAAESKMPVNELRHVQDLLYSPHDSVLLDAHNSELLPS